MPNIWAHFIFGETLLERCGLTDWVKHPHLAGAFRLGCQGPDFLFYHQFLPWQSDKRLNELGSIMHKENCGPFLLELLARSFHAEASETDALYALGFTLHHVLDRNMHPYVFYRSGFKKWDHQRFEIMMDTRIAAKLRRVETWRTPVWQSIYTGSALPGNAAEHMREICAALYPEKAGDLTAGDYNAAYRDMIAAQKLFYDPYGIKRMLTAGQIGPLVFKRKLPDLDLMNERRRPWRDPCDGSSACTDSVWDMWEAALSEGERITEKLTDLRMREKAAGGAGGLPDALRKAIGNISYETGKPCGSGAEIRYSEPII